MSDTEATQDSSAPGLKRWRLARTARDAAMIIAIVAGILHVAGLWAQPLGAASLVEAGQGVLLILLALGLMGSARLSVVLAALFSAGSITKTLMAGSAWSLVSSTECALLVLSLVALIAPTPHHHY